MQKYLVNVLIASLVVFLAGCQSTPVGSRGLGPLSIFPPAISPQMNLAQSVQEALMRNDELAIAPIRVDTQQNVVILSGYVKKIRQSDTAEQIARQVPGVQSVENRIIVRP